MQAKLFLPLAGVLFLGLAACGEEPQATEAESPFRPVATIQDIMDSEIDPAADYLWGAVAYVDTESGPEERQPRTDEDWEKARHNALILIEATNLLAIEGRKVAAEGSPLDEEEYASEHPDDIQKAIDANRAAFVTFAHGLHDAGMQMLAAIEARDVAAMERSGEVLDQACEQCHRTFWYPNAVEPIQTLEPQP